jgi:hypothetical protein
MSEIAQGRDGHALGLDAQNRLRWVELTPAYRDPRFRPYLERPARDREVSPERSRHSSN